VTSMHAVLAALGGLGAGPVLRGLIFYHSVPSDQPWRRECPQCNHHILRVPLLPPTGKCPNCRNRVGPPAGTVELVAAAALTILALRADTWWTFAAWAWLALIGIASTFIDVAVHRLPDRLTYAAFAGVVVLLAGNADLTAWVQAVGSGLGMAFFYLVLAVVYPSGMGLGDVKLALSLGTALGWMGWVATVYGTALGFLLAAGYSLVMLALRKITRKDSIPHGPFMMTGALLVPALLG
jgi:leader peptidase (prepilin peptidase)/N-methyltransferase